ncbi:MAG: AAA family ATPase [Fimbriimonadaceae bacterium]
MASKKQQELIDRYEDPVQRLQWQRELEIELERQSRLFRPISFNRRPVKFEQDFLIEGLLAEGYLTILAGEPKEGKTCLATAMAVAVSTGTPFAGLETTKSPVLWLSLEETHDERAHVLQHVSQDIRKRSAEGEFARREAGENGSLAGELPIYTCYSHIPIDTDEGVSVLHSWLTQTGARFLVVDPLHGAHSGRSLKDAWAARKTLRKLKEFCGNYNVCALVLHHISQYAGNLKVAENAQLSATASMFMLLTCSQIPETPGGGEANPKSNRLISLQCRGRGEFANRRWHFVSRHPLDYEQTTPPEKAVDGESLTPTLNPVEQRIIEVLADGEKLTSADILDYVDATPGTVRNALSRMYNRGDVIVAYLDYGKRHYTLPKHMRMPKDEVAQDASEKSEEHGQ